MLYQKYVNVICFNQTSTKNVQIIYTTLKKVDKVWDLPNKVKFPERSENTNPRGNVCNHLFSIAERDLTWFANQRLVLKFSTCDFLFQE